MSVKFKYSLVAFALFLYFAESCKTNDKKKFKNDYYVSGKLKSKGWYIQDSIAVDTLFYFYENGNVEQVEVRDDSGFLTGKTWLYNENGQIYEVANYVKNAKYGFVYKYNNGILDTKNLFVNNTQVGDVFGFDTNGNINYYAFFDFEERNRNLMKWSSDHL